MTQKLRNTPIFPLVLLVAAGVVMALFWMTRGVDADRHTRTLGVLNQLIQLDTALDRDALRVSSFLLSHYDGFIKLHGRIAGLQAELRGPDLGLYGEIDAGLDGAIERYGTLHEDKLALLERLKRHAAIVRNTLRYLPLAGEQAGRDGSVHQQHADLHELIIAVLSFNIFPEEATRKKIEDLVADLKSKGDRPKIADNIILHSTKSREASLALAGVVKEILALPVRDALEDILDRYTVYYVARTQRADRYRVALLALSIALFAGIGVALTRLRKAHLETEGARTRLLDAIESIPEAFALFDTEDRLVLSNRNFGRFYPTISDDLKPGVTFRDLTEKSLKRGQYGDATGDLEERVEERLEKRHRFAPPWEQPQADGRWYLVSDGPTSDGGIVSVRTDITMQKQAEESMRKLSLAVEHSPASIVITAPDGTIEYVNPKFCEVTGYRAMEAIGQNPRILKSGEMSKEQYDILWKTITSGQTWQGELHNKRKDGSLYWEWASITPIIDDDDEVTHFLAVKEDITLRKEMEDSLRETINRLTQSNAELERFAFAASHDLQEPLRMVTNYTGLLSKKYRGKFDKDADEYMDFAVEGAKRMHRLITGLLEYARVDGKSVAFSPVDCTRVFNEVQFNLRDAVVDCGAAITATDLPTVTGDEVQIIQLFQNLVSNALKFRRDEVPPEVRLTAQQRDDGRWLFAVADNGIGIEEEYLGRIFDVFKRLHTRQAFPGDGIGLAMCRRIVERHGGEIWVESKPGEGSTFYFTLTPAADAAAELPEAAD